MLLAFWVYTFVSFHMLSIFYIAMGHKLPKLVIYLNLENVV